jgi:hypothetical protein
MYNALQSIQAFEAGTGARKERERETAMKGIGNALAGGDWQTGASTAFKMGDLGTGMEIQKYGKGLQDAEAEQKRLGLMRYGMGLLNTPQQQRETMRGQIAQALVGMGIQLDEQQAAAMDLSDEGIRATLSTLQDTDGLMKQYQAQMAPTQYGFQNVQGVGVVRTDPRSGNAEVAYQLPEELRAAAGADNVQSVQVLDNGEIAIVRRNGTLEPTGKFARNPYQITNIGEVPYAVDRITGGASAISTPEAVGTSKATVSTVVSDEEDRRTAQKNLPDVISKANSSINTLTQLRDHPALKFRYGLLSVGGARPVIPGTPEAEVQALINQAGGQAFLQAFETLKGGGQITQIEGEKATAAITRLGNQNLTVEDAVQAISELIEIAENAKTRARAKASGSYGTQNAANQRLKYNPETGEFE